MVYAKNGVVNTIMGVVVQETFSDRIRLVLGRRDMTLKDLERASGIPYRSLQNYMSGALLPGAENLSKLREALQVNVDWLLTGAGRSAIPQPGETASDVLFDFFRSFGEIEEEQEWIVKTTLADPKKSKTIIMRVEKKPEPRQRTPSRAPASAQSD